MLGIGALSGEMLGVGVITEDELGVGVIISGDVLGVGVISEEVLGVDAPSEDTLALGVDGLDSSSSTLLWKSPLFPGGSYRATTARKGLVWLKAFPKPTLFESFHTT